MVFVLCYCLIIAAVQAVTISSTDLYSLYDIYNAAAGDSWVWSSSASAGIPWNFTEALINPSLPCNANASRGWQGILCASDCTVCNVLEIDLHSFNLVGTIAPSIGNMSMVTLLDLSRNDLSSTLPESLGSLSGLLTLNMNTNYRLSGTLPSSLFNSVDMERVGLSQTDLRGSFPSEISNWQLSLMDLEVSQAGFSGPIPTIFGDFQVLTYLDLSLNTFTGTIPSAIFGASLLEVLGLGGNSLSGTVPSEVAQLADTLVAITLSGCGLKGSVLPLLLPQGGSNATQLRYADLAFNGFTGTVPDAIGSLTAIMHLYCSYNSLTGTLPQSLGLMTQALGLEFKKNYLTGTIPSELAALTLLDTLDLYYNILSGELPAPLCSLHSLTEVDVGANSLHGTIPSLIGQLTLLKVLGLNNNFFTGRLPSSLGSLTSLATLLLGFNVFTGSEGGIFTEQAALSLSVLDISSNNFHGPLPDSIFLLPNLTVIAATKNCFSGSMPSTICRATNLEQVGLDGLSSSLSCRKPIILPTSSGVYYSNTLKGSIPSCLMQLPRLVVLQLSGNGFTGNIPNLRVDSATGKPVSNLVNISLAHNRLTGFIPQSLQQYTGWQYLDLSFNKLKGTLDYMTNFTVDVADLPPNSTHYATALALHVNRLSGGFPNYLAEATVINILQGNHFSCANDGKDLPENDPSYKNYYCGSFELNRAWQNWGFVLFFVMLLFLVRRLCSREGSVPQSWWLVELWDRTLRYISQARAQMELQDVSVQEVGPLSTLEIRSMLFMLKSLRSFTWRVALIAVVACIPAYAAVSDSYYSTITFQYGWIISGAYISGFSMGICFLGLWAGIIWFAHYLVVRTHVLLCAFIDRNIEEAKGVGSRARPHTPSNVVAADSTADTSPNRPRTSTSAHIQMALTVVKRSLGTIALSEGASSERNIEGEVYSSHRVNRASEHRRSWPETLYLYAALPLLNGSFVVAANGIYVYALLTTHSYRFGTLYGVLLVGFKTVWNMMVVPALVRSVASVRSPTLPRSTSTASATGSGHIALGEVKSVLHEGDGMGESEGEGARGVGGSASSDTSSDTGGPRPSDYDANERVLKDDAVRNYHMQVLLLVFNNVVAPCLATAAADSHCFYSIFVPPEDVISYYNYPACSSFATFGDPSASNCADYVYIGSTPTVYTPPYMYYYECSTSLLVNYVPVFVYYYLFLGIVLPLVYYFTVLRAIRKSTNKFDTIVTFFERNRAGVLLFIPGNFACSVVGHLSVLLTFGVLYPPLAVLITLYIFSLTRVWHSVLDSLLAAACADTDQENACAPGSDSHSGTADADTEKEDASGSKPSAPRATMAFGEIDIDLGPCGSDTDDSDRSTGGGDSGRRQPRGRRLFLLHLERECINIWSVLFDSRHVLVGVSSLFMACFLVDMVGDHAMQRFDHGFRAVVWVPVAMLLWGLVIGHQDLLGDLHSRVCQARDELCGRSQAKTAEQDQDETVFE